MLPSGTVTFLFTDIEGSTQRWETFGESMREALRRHDALMREIVERHRGCVFKTVGDAFHSVFNTATDAAGAALEAQRALQSMDWSGVNDLRVRMALHTGVADERDGDYFGSAVNRAARLLSIGYGGQILVSGVTTDLVQGELPVRATLRDLGAHRLKDLAYPEQVYQLLSPDLPSEFPPLRSLGVLPNNLPLQLTSFVGRDEELAQVDALLSKHRLVTIVGAGGVGKTRMSLQVAADHLDAYADGVWLVELAPLTEAELIGSTIASSLGVATGSNQQALDAAVAHLRDRRSLLIFDNCEHLISAVAPIVERILQHCPHTHVLANGREGLGIAGECVYRMPSLRVPPAGGPLTASEAMQYGAIVLFAERANALSAFTLTDDNAPLVGNVCRRLDGIPLAIELAAPRLRVFSIEELERRLNDRFHLLTGGSRSALPRQQTLRALFDWSYELLSDSEKTLFRRLGIFVNGWTLDALSAVCTDERLEARDIVDRLQSLIEKSLVVAEIGDAGQRYRLLESTRQYALERLSQAAEARMLACRHADYYRQLAIGSDTDARTLPSEGFIAAYEPELDNFRSALDWSLGTDGDEEIAVGLAGNMRPIWRRLGLAPEGLRVIDAVLETIGSESTEAGKAHVWTALSEIASLLFLNARALEAAQRAAAIYQSLGDDEMLHEALFLTGAVLRQMGREADAIEPLRRSLEFARRTGDQYRVGQRLNHLAVALAAIGKSDEACELIEEARGIYRSLGMDSQLVLLTLHLAEIEAGNDNFERAIELGREVLAKTSDKRFSNLKSASLVNLAGYLCANGETDEAAELLRTGVRLTVERHEAVLFAACMLHTVAVAIARERPVEGARLLGYADAAYEALGSTMERVERHEHRRLADALSEELGAHGFRSAVGAGRLLDGSEAAALATRLFDLVSVR